jgi:signal transduction histidine kinase
MWQLGFAAGDLDHHLVLDVASGCRLRQRERELAAANRRLEASSMPSGPRHMLQTTHQLKAPFAAIHANTQLLLKGICGPAAEPARAVIEKIASRAQMLSQQIQQMLQLANLRSQSQTSRR